MDPIAIIGFAFKLPGGAEDESSLWNLLQEARNVMKEYPPSRVNLDAFYSPSMNRDNTMYSKGAHFLEEDPAVFDAPFFMISKNEAASMDPQQRKLLEVSYHALENAGIPMEEAAGSDTAVFASTMANDFERMMAKDPDTNAPSAIVGTSPTIVAGRLSWFFDFKGPCMHLDTACSSSLTALDLACQNLRNRTSKMALVAGSNLILSSDVSLSESNMLFLSPDSQCKTFTSGANGYGRGEGVVALILKRLSDVVADGDVIRAVIRGSGSNQDGRTQGLGRPSANAQQALIERTYQDAKLDFSRTRFFEAHGTGTAVGDPTEIKAIGRVFRTYRSPNQPLYVGSIKANIGHIEAGSGIASVVKAILVLEQGVIPPNALFDELNPEIDDRFYNLKVPTVPTPWPSAGLRRVSINSFGFGGSNAHIILDDAKHFLEEHSLLGYHRTSASTSNTMNGHHHSLNSMPCRLDESTKIIILSGKDEGALKRLVRLYDEFYHSKVRGDPKKLHELAYTLATRRTQFPWRSFVVIDPVSHKDQWKTEDVLEKAARSDTSRLGIAFVFTGQGAQYADMGQQLMVYHKFASILQKIKEVYNDLGAPWNLLDKLSTEKNIHDPEFSQPLCTALQIALVELLESWNIKPDIVVGHSSGEIAAAYAAGALTLKQACGVAYWRGKLTGMFVRSRMRPGAMLSVNVSEQLARELVSGYGLSDTLTVACINSPSNVTISGDETDIDTLKARLTEDAIQAFRVNTSAAYHSPAMLTIADDYRMHLSDMAQEVTLSTLPSQAIMVSSVNGEIVTAKQASTAQYWVDNFTSPVRFSEAIQRVVRINTKTSMKLGTQNLRPIHDIVEIGPHSTLQRPITECLGEVERSSHKPVRYHSILKRLQPKLRFSLELPARLATFGYPVNLTAVNSPTTSSKNSPLLLDTPSYPFDKSQRYWKESRLSRDFRLRGGTTADSILGVRVSDWNPLEPRWRKFISVEDVPWVADHVITGTPLYPATGMLIMALTAVQANFDIQQSRENTVNSLSGFEIKEALFLAPIIVRSRVELQTQLRPKQNLMETSATWYEVHIYTYTDVDDGMSGRWMECFRATIKVQRASSLTEVDGGQEASFATAKARHDLAAAQEKCVKTISKDSFYSYHTAHGLQYGPRFQLADDIRCHDDGTSIATLHNSVEDCPTGGFAHPATLDAAFQTCMTAAWTNVFAGRAPTFVPHRLFDAFFSATEWTKGSSSRLQVMSTSALRSAGKGATCRVLVLNSTGEILCDFRNLEISPISSHLQDSSQPHKQLIYAMEWKPLLSMMDGKQLAAYCRAQSVASEEFAASTAMVSFYTGLERTLIDVIQETVSKVSATEVGHLPEHLQYYFSWMQLQLRTHRPGCLPGDSTTRNLDFDASFQRLVTEKPSWKLFVTIARNLEPILRGITDPLEYMFSTGEAEAFYADVGHQICRKVAPFFTLAAHENPKQLILEVGAGTGSMTHNLLRIYQAYEKATGATAFSQYTYTDISSAFFERAKAKFADLDADGRMLYHTLDLDNDAVAQGFAPQTYDLIIAGSVIHATSSIKSTLLNLRKLLKPQGRLVLLEITAPEKIVGSFAFGTLPGWWRGVEAKEVSSPAVNEETWGTLLQSSGFSGNDAVIRDWEDPRCHDFSLIISSAGPEETSSGRLVRDNVTLITSSTTNQDMLLEELMQELEHRVDCNCTIEPFENLTDPETAKDDVKVFLLELVQPLLNTLDDASFEKLKSFLLKATKVLWVCAAPIEEESYSAKSLSTGLLRSLRSEDVRKHIVTLTIEDKDVASNKHAVVAYVAQVLKKSFQQGSRELEYVVREKACWVSRLSYNEILDTSVRNAIIPTEREEAWTPEVPVKLSVHAPGALESFYFTEDFDHETDLGPHQVELEAKAWGLSFRDVFLALGRLDEQDGFGFECAGYVRKIGSQCTGFAIGDRVCMTARGSMRQYPRSHEKEIHKIPNEMSFEEAASMIGPAITAVYSLIEIARLQRGEKVLIHSAAGATGQLAVMLAQSLGAEVYCTVGSDKKRDHLMNNYGIAKERILYSRDSSFALGIKRLTKGHGVDVLLNSLSGDGLIEGWKCMAPYGRFIELGKVDIMSDQGLPMAGFQRNITFAAIDFYHITRYRKDITKEMLSKVMLLARAGVFKAPSPLHVYSASKVEQAFRLLQSGQHIGRIVIVPQDGDTVQKWVRKKPTWKFHPGACYLIVGGFGGLGRAILPWMVSKGARHIIVLSRKGPASIAARNLIADLEAQGARICAPRCDVSSRKELEAILQSLQTVMPPIKGCINSAMMLQDTFFANMSRSQWTGTVDSKLKSSQNLSALLPKDLDFFILFSSLSGVYGTPGQSNYAAGCTSQDALARQRVQQGLKAISIDIGWMRTIGVVAESELYQRVREREADMQQIEEDEFLALLDICCDPNSTAQGADGSQILLGPVVPSAIRAQGQEPPPILQRPLFLGFDKLPSLEGLPSLHDSTANASTTLARLERAGTVDQKNDIAVEALVGKIARALGIATKDIDTTRPLFEYGVDSLVALELRNWVLQEFRSEVTVFDIMGGISIMALSSRLVE